MLQNSSSTETVGTGVNLNFSGIVNWLGRINTSFVGGTGLGNANMTFWTPSGGSLFSRMTLDYAGNLGLGVVPDTWGGGNVALQIGGDPFSGINANLRMAISTNAYAIGTTYYYRATGLSSQQYRLSVGTNNHEWYVAPPGTSGNPITYNQAMTLASNGYLGIGISNPSSYLHTYGYAAATWISTFYNSGTLGHEMYFGYNNGINTQYGLYIRGGNAAGSNFDFAIDNNKFRVTSIGNTIIGSNVDPGQKLYLNGSLRIDGQTSGTAGGSSGQHLIINCDGTTYKIALLNN